jgi:hypothetical protein
MDYDELEWDYPSLELEIIDECAESDEEEDEGEEEKEVTAPADGEDIIEETPRPIRTESTDQTGRAPLPLTILQTRRNGDCFFDALSLMFFGTTGWQSELRELHSRAAEAILKNDPSRLLWMADYLVPIDGMSPEQRLTKHIQEIKRPQKWATRIDAMIAAIWSNEPIAHVFFAEQRWTSRIYFPADERGASEKRGHQELPRIDEFTYFIFLYDDMEQHWSALAPTSGMWKMDPTTDLARWHDEIQRLIRSEGGPTTSTRNEPKIRILKRPSNNTTVTDGRRKRQRSTSPDETTIIPINKLIWMESRNERMTEKELKEKELVRQNVEKALNDARRYPSVVVTVGGTANRFGLKGSDVDLTVLTRNEGFRSQPIHEAKKRGKKWTEEQRAMFRIKDDLVALDKKIEAIPAKIAPLCKLKMMGHSVDITPQNINSIRSSILIAEYAIEQPIAVVLMDVIKVWTKKHGHQGAKEGSMNHYCWTLMLMFFLRSTPRLLPNETWYRQAQTAISDSNLRQVIDWARRLEIQRASQEATESHPERLPLPNYFKLLMQFFKFVAKFDFSHNEIDIFEIEVKPRTATRYPVVVIDPFTGQNAARAILMEKIDTIKNHAERTYLRMKNVRPPTHGVFTDWLVVRTTSREVPKRDDTSKSRDDGERWVDARRRPEEANKKEELPMTVQEEANQEEFFTVEVDAFAKSKLMVLNDDELLYIPGPSQPHNDEPLMALSHEDWEEDDRVSLLKDRRHESTMVTVAEVYQAVMGTASPYVGEICSLLDALLLAARMESPHGKVMERPRVKERHLEIIAKLWLSKNEAVSKDVVNIQKKYVAYGRNEPRHLDEFLCHMEDRWLHVITRIRFGGWEPRQRVNIIVPKVAVFAEEWALRLLKEHNRGGGYFGSSHPCPLVEDLALSQNNQAIVLVVEGHYLREDWIFAIRKIRKRWTIINIHHGLGLPINGIPVVTVKERRHIIEAMESIRDASSL